MRLAVLSAVAGPVLLGAGGPAVAASSTIGFGGPWATLDPIAAQIVSIGRIGADLLVPAALPAVAFARADALRTAALAFELAEARTRLITAEQDAADAIRDRDALAAEAEDLRTRTGEAERRAAEATAALDALATERADIMAALHEVREQRDDLLDEAGKLRSQREAWSSSTAELQRQVDDLQELAGVSLAQTAELRAANGGLTASVEQLRTTSESVTAERDRMSAALAASQQALDAVYANAAGLWSERNVLRDEQATVRAKLLEQDVLINMGEADLRGLVDERRSLVRDNERLRQQLADVHDLMVQIETTLRTADENDAARAAAAEAANRRNLPEPAAGLAANDPG